MCGIFGIFGHPDAAELTVLGLHALQHRGQESAGVVSFSGTDFRSEKRLGLVGDHFTKASTVARLKGQAAIGHVRYSTTGETIVRNIQPMFADFIGGGFAIAHNGNITNAMMLHQELVRDGAIFQSTSDTEIVIHLTARAPHEKLLDRFTQALLQLEGAFSLVALSSKKLIAVRDPNGIRPLVLGQLDSAYVICSETVALDIIGAQYIRDIEPGELIAITQEGIESRRPFERVRHLPCIFEYVYFARPDSWVEGRNVYTTRQELGTILAQEVQKLGVRADVVIPVPDSGTPAALGFARTSGIPFELGLIRNHYVGRTFIEPTQEVRQLGVKLKHNVNKSAVAGKSIMLVDDSVVRGTTSSKIVRMLREAGAKHVHMAIACPPILHPDFYGIDMPEKKELLAANHSHEEMRAYLGVDSLTFLSIDGMYQAMGYPEGRVRQLFSDHCFTGEYPTPLSDRDQGYLYSRLSYLHEE